MITLKTNEWELNNIDTVFFDKDGTFVDSHVYWGEIIKRRIKRSIERYALPEKDVSALCLAMGYNPATKKLKETGPVGIASREEVISRFIEEIKNRYGLSVPFDEIDNLFKEVHSDFKKDADAFIVPIAGCVDFFERLKQNNVRMAVITSDAKEMTLHTLKLLDLEKYFDLVITKEDTTEPKHTGKPALLALEKMNATVENTITIGDAPMDAQMAKNAGLKAAVLLATGQISQENLKKYSGFVAGSYSFEIEHSTGELK